MENVASVKPGIIAVSRDCFPKSLAERRREAVAKEYGAGMYNCKKIVESENDIPAALKELAENGVNALIVFLGNFGPEGPETILAKTFPGEVMFAAAAEESASTLQDGRGDAYCGMLNAGYNIGLRGIRAYIPEYPVGSPREIAAMIREFIPIARTLLSLKSLKIISFGPRPADFYACNAPIKCLYDMNIELEENSELDLLAAFNKRSDDKRIPAIEKEMAAELGEGNLYPGILSRLAQYELTLSDWCAEHKGSREYVAIAAKCWPAFQSEFKFVPCYVNGRLAAKGLPVACETDIYGALSEYIITAATLQPAMLLDINNTVPADMAKNIAGYRPEELFMGFHCGNGSACCMKKPSMKYQKIMHSLLEPGKEPDITRGTLEGDINPGKITIFRLQAGADAQPAAYIAQGEVVDSPTNTFGTTGIFGIKEMARFYRHVLIEQRFPHHTAVGQGHSGKYLFEVMKALNVPVSYNRPKALPYPRENIF